MRGTGRIARVLIAASLSATTIGRAQATSAVAVTTTPVVTTDMTRRFAEIAPVIVRASNLGAGKTALIEGGAFMLPLMQELALEIERAGASALMITTTDSLERLRVTAPSAQRLRRLSVAIALLNNADVTFTFPLFEDASIYNNRPPESVKADQSADSLWRAARRTTELHGRHVVIAVPLPRDTANLGLSYDEVASTRWKAMLADYAQIAATGAAIQRRLATARKIRVTSPEGTDLTFSLVKGRVAVEAGTATPIATSKKFIGSQIPGGTVYAVVDASSVSGAIRAPWDWCELSVENEAIDVVHGRPTKISASRDEECIRKALQPLNFGLLSIGLNPENTSATTGARVPANDFNGAGMVVLAFGLNTFAGGSDTGPGQWAVPQPKATVYADGVPIVREGRIVVSQLQARRPQ